MKESKRQAVTDFLMLAQLFLGAFAIFGWVTDMSPMTPFWLEAIATALAVGSWVLPLAFLLRLNRSHQQAAELSDLKAWIHRGYDDIQDTNQ